MSRTIRRKTGELHYNVIWDFSTESLSHGCYRRLEGDKLKAKLVWWHSDAGYGYHRGNNRSYREGLERVQRSRDKYELIRYNKDAEYEVQCYFLPRPYWD